MSAKAEAPSKATRRREKEAREITRREREQARPKRWGYLYYMLFIICVVYISDEVATQIGTQMQSVLAQAIFEPVFGSDMAVARMSALGSLSLIGSVVSIFYKPLSDRYGRRPFLVINTLGMGLGLIVIAAAFNIPVYILGAILIALFNPNDMQVVYILESTPARHRAKMFSVIKGVATVGVMMIPLLRKIFMGADITRWRMVYVVPSLVAAAAAAFSLFFVRETEAFNLKRLEYLRMSEEQREEEKRKKNAENAQGGFVSALKFCLGNRQLRWLFLGIGFLAWGTVMTMYYETTMTYGYASRFIAEGASVEAAKISALPFVTDALFWFPVGSAVCQLMQGFFADKWGRKPTSIIVSVCSAASYALFFFGATHNWSPWTVGFLCGAAIGSYWATLDVTGPIMCSESAPTNLRSSVLAVLPIFSFVFGVIGIGGGLLLINILGDAYVSLVSLGVSVPGLLIGLVIIMWKVRETKSVNLEEVTGREE